MSSSDLDLIARRRELLRDVLTRIEESESSWPRRREVVACAGVCRSWREILKEIVKIPEFEGRITFPISLKQPGPRDFPMQCFIRRNRTNHTYSLYLGLTQALTDDGKFLLAARKCRRATCTDYIISLDADDISKGSGTYIGKLRSNLLGTKFTVYDAQPPYAGAVIAKSCSTRLVSSRQVSPRVPAGNYPVAHISYELNVLGSRGPRRMQCIMNSIPASAIEPGGTAPTQAEFLINSLDSFSSMPFFRSKSSRSQSTSGSLSGLEEGILVLKNKAPRWHEQLQCWCLNFRGRVTVASVKNFQLVASEENGATGQEQDKVILQFGKVGKDLFTMDFQYPISAFQAFAICLSSFDTKIAWFIHFKVENRRRSRLSFAIPFFEGTSNRLNHEANRIGLESMDVEALKKMNKNKKLVKKLAKKYHAFLASEAVIKQIPRLLGPGLNKAGKFPTLVSHQESLESKVNETKAMVKFQLKKVLCMGVAVGNCGMEEKQIFQNVQLSVNFLVSLLKKNWQNVRCLYLKSTMGKPFRVF
ncbi:uncharacterized protein A4U43_C05F1100 [Asparagus officinalis]|uniref:Tubby C-terminal domain-containing protein n=1 Tax=Asparagus officinalis TaxID=4686 RepID=A0A5P1ETZ8_ASPOF|nr:uncharacterized protein A4U43_C05F1100 [Asparagus officinalis]